MLTCVAMQTVIAADGQSAKSVSIESLTPFIADYEVRRSRVKIATAHYELFRDGDTYVYETRGEASGVGRLVGGDMAEERSRFKLYGNDIQQIDYEYKVGSGKNERNRRIEFDWDSSKVNITRKGVTRSFDIHNSVVDLTLLQLVVMVDIANNNLKKSYVAVGKRSPRNIQFKKMSEEIIEVPAGKFRTIKIEGLQKRRKGDRVTRYWCAQELGWLPVKIEQYRNGDGPFVMMLSNLRGLGRD